jgi:hypothetical protein
MSCVKILTLHNQESNLELPLFSGYTVIPFNNCVHSCRPFFIYTTFFWVLGVEVSSFARTGQLTLGVQITIWGIWRRLLLIFLPLQILQIPAQWFHRRTKRPNTQTSPLISDLNSKINSPDQATKEISNPNYWNNDWFELQLSNAQVRRQKKRKYPTRLVENVALGTKGL